MLPISIGMGLGPFDRPPRVCVWWDGDPVSTQIRVPDYEGSKVLTGRNSDVIPL